MITVEILQAFSDAWNRHDIDALMSFMTEDCEFPANAGPDVAGLSFVGAAEVRRGFMRAWQHYPNARWNDARHFVSGDRGASEWVFTGTAPDGSSTEVVGCDLFTFRDGKIALKNSFRKHRS